MNGKTIQCTCDNCGSVITVRVADRKRGWGKFCSKSCKAKNKLGTARSRVTTLTMMTNPGAHMRIGDDHDHHNIR